MKDLVDVQPKAKDEEAAKLLGLTIKELKQVKDAILQLKQGETLERSSWPREMREALGLGYFDVETSLALATLNAFQIILNSISGLNSTLLSDFSKQVAIASGSRQHIRLTEVLLAVAKLGSSKPQPMFEFPQPEHMGAPETED